MTASTICLFDMSDHNYKEEWALELKYREKAEAKIELLEQAKTVLTKNVMVQQVEIEELVNVLERLGDGTRLSEIPISVFDSRQNLRTELTARIEYARKALEECK